MRARDTANTAKVLLIALASIAVLLLVLRPDATARRLVSRWQPPLTAPEPQASQSATPAPISGAAIPLASFDTHVDDGLYPDERAPLAADLQRALGYVVERFGSGPSARFTAVIDRDDGCGLRGIAYTDVRQMHVFTCPGIPRARAVAIMAHEFTHQLEQDRYGDAHMRSDLILSEGAATWAAGEYWLGGQPDFRSYVREQRRAGTYYPLATDYSGLGVGAMNALYYEWASFVEYLIGAYGREQFDRLYVSGQGAIGSSDYAGVYGKPLGALEQEWLAWLGG